MKKSVGLVLMVSIQGEKCAVLQRRGTYNFADDKPESFPGACQVTAHGKLEEGEDFIPGLQREVAEELGLVLTLEPKHLVLLVEEKKDDTPEKEGKHVITYGAHLYDASLDLLRKIRLESGSGGLVLLPLSKLDQLSPLDPKADKKDGVKDRDAYKMFADEIAAVKLAFEKVI